MKQAILLTIAIVAIGAFTGCSDKTPESMPPGYTLVCNDKGLYSSMMPKGGHIIGSTGDEAPKKTKKEAIKRAWSQYKFGLTYKPKPKEIWLPCE